MEQTLNLDENLTSFNHDSIIFSENTIINNEDLQSSSKKNSSIAKINEIKQLSRHSSIGKKKYKRSPNNQILNNPKLDDNKKTLFSYLLIEPTDRSKNQVEFIKKYILQNTSLIENLNHSIGNVFQDKSKDMFDLNAIVTEICRFLKYKNIYYGNKVFRIGESEDNIYYIFKGIVEIVKPEKFSIKMNGFEYFTYIMRLKRDNEKYLIQLIFESKNKFVINREDFKNLNYIFLYIKLKDYFKNKEKGKDYEKSEIIKIIKSCFCDPQNILENFTDEDNINEKILKQEVFKISEDVINFYYSMATNPEQCDIYLYKYHSVKTLKEGSSFGEPGGNKRNLREYTVNTLEDCYFGYLEVKQYDAYLKLEKEQKIKDKSNFLLSNFFFGTINETTFSNRYLSLFLYEENSQGISLINQNDKIDYIYFIKDGSVELSCSHSVYSSYGLLLRIHAKILQLDLDEVTDFLLAKNRNKRNVLEKDYSKLINSPIVIKNKNSIIALESFLFDFNSLYNAKIIGQKISYYKLHVNSLRKILKENREVISYGKEKARIEIKLISKRLLAALNIRVHSIKLKEADLNNEIRNNNLDKMLDNNFSEKEKKRKKVSLGSLTSSKKTRKILNANLLFDDFNKNNKRNDNNNVFTSINDDILEDNNISISVKNELNLVNKLQLNIEKNLLFFKSNKKFNTSKISSNNSKTISNTKNLKQQNSNILFSRNSNNIINSSNKFCQTENCNSVLSKIKNKNFLLQTYSKDKIHNKRKLKLINTEKSNRFSNPGPLTFKVIKTTQSNNLDENNDKKNYLTSGLNEDNTFFSMNGKQKLNYFSKNDENENLKNNQKLIYEANFLDFDKLPASYIQFIHETNEGNYNDFSTSYGQSFRQGKVKSIKYYQNKKFKYNEFKTNYFAK